MDVCLFAIKDSAINKFMPAFTAPNEAAAVRAVRNLVNSAGPEVALNPEDYDLWLLGTYNDDTGVIEPLAPRMIVRCRDLERS